MPPTAPSTNKVKKKKGHCHPPPLLPLVPVLFCRLNVSKAAVSAARRVSMSAADRREPEGEETEESACIEYKGV